MGALVKVTPHQACRICKVYLDVDAFQPGCKWTALQSATMVATFAALLTLCLLCMLPKSYD